MDSLPWGNHTELLFFSGFIVPSEGLFSVLLEKEAGEDTLGLYCPPPLTDFLPWKKKCTYSCSLSEQVTCCKTVLEHSAHCALENGSILSVGIVLFGFCFVLFFMLKRFFIVVFSNYTGEGTTNSFSLHDPMESWSLHVQRKLFELSPLRLPSKDTELCKLNFLCSQKVVNQVTSSSDFLWHPDTSQTFLDLQSSHFFYYS